MAEAIKNTYSPAFYKLLAEQITTVLPEIDGKSLYQQLNSKNLPQMEWKERLQHTTAVLASFLPADFKKAAPKIKKLVTVLQKEVPPGQRFPYLFIPDYIAQSGIAHLEHAAALLCHTTQLISCEFAVRPFIQRYETEMLDYLHQWSLHPHPAVRRLASEGSRPRLPWGIALQSFISNPSPMLPILENLKNDDNPSVRLSVANHLNDISKTHPQVLLAVIKKWKNTSPETNALIKHACRTLFKKGHPEILNFFELKSVGWQVTETVMHTPDVPSEGILHFSFNVKNTGKKALTTRLEYAIYLLKANGSHFRKVFKISERQIPPGEQISINKNHSFKLITTRVYYSGLHKLAVIINGVEQPIQHFNLL